MLPFAAEIERRATVSAPRRTSDTRFWLTWTLVVAAGAAVIGYEGRSVFLWSDDYVFLPDTAKSPLDLQLLRVSLFRHFTPVSHLVNKVVVSGLADNPWLIRTVLLLLSTLVIASVGFLMVSLFGRTWIALAGTALAGPSLGLLPLVNWWTAGLNMMPALIGAALCLGAVVRVVRRPSLRWSLLAVGGYLLAILSWELGITAVAFAALWTVLFRARVTDEPLRTLLARTWRLWLVLGLLAVAAVVNFRLYYYDPTPAPSVALALDALRTSLFTVQLPMVVGLFGPVLTTWRTVLVVSIAAFFVVVVVVTLVRSRRAWRGWTFALVGWLVPVLSVVTSRVGYIGIPAVEQSMYYYLPTLLFIVGALEAWVAPSWPHREEAVAARAPAVRRRAIAMAGLGGAAIATAFMWSTVPTIATTNYGMIGSPTALERDYMANLVASAKALETRGAPFSVINGVAPAGLLNFQGHNRLSQITKIYDPTLTFDAPEGPYYVPVSTGQLIPATIRWGAELSLPAQSGALTLRGVTLEASGDAMCFRVDQPSAYVRWDLPQPATGGPVAIRTMSSVDQASRVRVSTVGEPSKDPVVTNVNPRAWSPSEDGRLDTTPEPQVSAVVFDSMSVGAKICLSSLKVGTVSTS